MNLLIVTQAVDEKDPVLGFFVQWIRELSTQYAQVTVICLRKGSHTLPANVTLYSLGKERRQASPVLYGLRFIALVWRLRHSYDRVFVHMNQEYVLLAGWLWRLLHKRVALWRNHHAGSGATTVAVFFSNLVFCTSKESYTATFKKTILMPVGIDTNYFTLESGRERVPHSILFLSRMAPSKRPEILVEALGQLAHEGVAFTASFVGSPLPQDQSYYERLKERTAQLGLGGRITFHPAVTNQEARALYRSHQIFVNASPSGMFDKTLFEAAACGCVVVAASSDFASLAGRATHFDSIETLAGVLKTVLAQPGTTLSREQVQDQSLAALGGKIKLLL